MNNENLNEIANSLLNFLWRIQHNVFDEEDSLNKFTLPLENLQDYLTKYPIPPSHIKVILCLSRLDSCPISQIAKKLKISKSNMTPIIDNLISYDLVNRYTDLNDRRVLRVELTPKAIKLFKDFRELAKNKILYNISKLSDEDLYTLDESLMKLLKIMGKLNHGKNDFLI